MGMAPSMPPSLRAILHLPQPTLARAPASVVRVGGQTRLLPPLSSLLVSSYASPHPHGHALAYGLLSRDSPGQPSLPTTYRPAPGSLVDTALRRLALDWQVAVQYYHYYLYDLPTHLKLALTRYLGVYKATGVTVPDLKLLLLPPLLVHDDGDDGVAQGDALDAAKIHALVTKQREQDLHHLDLTGSVGKHLHLAELSDLLFPALRHAQSSSSASPLHDSWEDAAAIDTAPSTSPTAVEHAMPRPLLPKLTHLSLALDRSAFPQTVSWRHLVSFLLHLDALTHLSLAFWPRPSFTPNAQWVSVATRTHLGGRTGLYSQSLDDDDDDDDWAEAIMVLQRLSRALYRLEYVDLTGCCAWAPALRRRAGHDEVDWVGHWGQVRTLVLDPGWRPGEPPALMVDRTRFRHQVDTANALERHIVARRAGRGRFITVETATVPADCGVSCSVSSTQSETHA